MSETLKPDTFHDEFYDCESTVDAGEGSREKVEKAAWWASSSLADVGNADELNGQIVELLDRQASITRREVLCQPDERDEQIAELTAERDELRRQVSELRELNDSLHARIEEAKEALS